MKKAYVVSAKRSPIGAFMGSLSKLHPAEYGAEVLKAALKEGDVSAEHLDEVIVGNILPAGLGMNVARQISLKAEVPETTPAYAVNMVCGSGMKSVINAVTSIQNGDSDVIAAGGVESMSKAPYILPDKLRKGNKMGGFKVKDHMIDDALTDVFNGIHMGVTAENIVRKYSISREAQDAFSLDSQKKAAKAQDEGRFKDEIVPIDVPDRKNPFTFEHDEHINRKATAEALAKLRPAFEKDGTVTAGNASGINDGASFMLIVSEDALEKYDLTPIAEIAGFGQGGVDPAYMGLGPTPAIKNALDHASLSIKDIGLFELNEAFAAQSLGVFTELEEAFGEDKESLLERTNVNGGAIALGHPVGASGNRITVTLLHEMLKRETSYGLASLCIGGGMGTTLILKTEGLQ